MKSYIEMLLGNLFEILTQQSWVVGIGIRRRGLKKVF